MNRYLAIILLPLLAACATQPVATGAPTPLAPATSAPVVSTDPIQRLVDKIASIAIPDLQAASADAAKHGDKVAQQCYDGLVPVVQSIQANPPITLPGSKPIGLATAFQDARDLKNGVTSAPSALKQIRIQINLACGALQMDVQAQVADPLGLFSGF